MRKIIFTQEMIEDFSKMGDVEFSEKWNVSRALVIRRRKELGVKSFNNKHNLTEHKVINDIEHKWCPQDGGHWSPISEFGKHKQRYDGLRSWCKAHQRKIGRSDYTDKDGASRQRKWVKTPNGHLSKRTTWRKQRAIRENAYVLWSPALELQALEDFHYCCAYCEKPITLEAVEFDHFIPIASGGKTEPSNMVPSCAMCNHGPAGKFTQEPKQWLLNTYIDGFLRYKHITAILSAKKVIHV